MSLDHKTGPLGHLRWCQTLNIGFQVWFHARNINTMDKDRGTMAALSAQLVAEISASDYGSVKAVARALGVDYHTYRKWVLGDKNLRMLTVFDTLELLGIETDVFFARVRERRDNAK